MPFGLLKKRQLRYRMVRTILVSLLCILLGLISTFWQAAANLKRTTNIRMTNARQLWKERWTVPGMLLTP